LELRQQLLVRSVDPVDGRAALVASLVMRPTLQMQVDQVM
jgi:hypothetical protein